MQINNYQTFISVTKVLLVTVPALLIIVFLIIAVRKWIGSMQSRLGPNATPCKVSLQSNVSFLAGPYLMICSKEFNESLNNIITSLDKDFFLHNCLNMLKYINQIQETDIFSSLINNVNYIVYFIPIAFTGTFLNMHASQYGMDFDPHYFDLLHDLYQQYTELYEINRNMHDAYNDLMEFYNSSLRTDFLNSALRNELFAGALTVDPDYTSRMERFIRHLELFLEDYDTYRDGIMTVEATLQQIQTINPDFTLPFPSFNPIVVAPLEWYILNSIGADIIWDPEIFQLQEFRPEILDNLRALALTINNSTDLFVGESVVWVQNQSRQTLTTLPFDSFAPAGSINIFEVEIQERRSRARTRRTTRTLPSDITPGRSRSRPGSSFRN